MDKIFKIICWKNLLIIAAVVFIAWFIILNDKTNNLDSNNSFNQSVNNAPVATSSNKSLISGQNNSENKKNSNISRQEEEYAPAALNLASSSSSAGAVTGEHLAVGDTVRGEIPATISVTLDINNDKYETLLIEGSSAYDLMKELKEAGRIDFKGKEFSGIGFFVEEINGVKNDPASASYWIYYINGQPANVGISSYKLKANDIISWKYLPR